MAYPPTPPPNDRVNTTPLVDNHPSDHNVIADFLSDIVLELGNDPKGPDASVEARLDRLEQELTPVGAIMAYAAGTTPPGNWLACDGGTSSRTTEAALFGIIGTTWGAGNGSTTFNRPDLQGRSLVGTGGALGAAIGDEAGAASAPIIAHTHPITDHDHGMSHTHQVNPPTTSMNQINWGGKDWHLLMQTTGGDATTGVSNTVFSSEAGAASIDFAGLGAAPDVQVNIATFTSGGSSAGTTADKTGLTTSGTNSSVSATNRNYHPVAAVEFWIKS